MGLLTINKRGKQKKPGYPHEGFWIYRIWVEGNELADQLEKEGAYLDFTDQEPFHATLTSFHKLDLENVIKTEKARRWKNEPNEFKIKKKVQN